MRPEHLLRFVVVNGLALGLGAVVATSCIKVNYPTIAFRCNPRQPDNCPETHFCCSDDPATANGDIPAYEGKGLNGSTPLYADAANGAGTSGMCVNRDEVPPGASLSSVAGAGCPIPCNPTWSDATVATVCPPMFICCQTVDLGPKDCVQEDGGPWRPVSGADIGNDAVVPATTWNAVAHDTHQDPNGTVCTALFGQGSAEWLECITNLSVADQRGYCLSAQVCPTDQPTYIDACEQLNGGAPM